MAVAWRRGRPALKIGPMEGGAVRCDCDDGVKRCDGVDGEGNGGCLEEWTAGVKDWTDGVAVRRDGGDGRMGRAMEVAWRSGGPALKIGQMEEPYKETAATTGRWRSRTNRRRRRRQANG